MNRPELHEPLRCPVCRAPWKDADACYRCGSDLTLLRSIRDAALRLQYSAQESLRRGRLDEAEALVTAARALFTDRRGIALEAYVLARKGKLVDALLLFDGLGSSGGD